MSQNAFSTRQPLTRDEISARVIPVLAEAAGMRPEQIHDSQRLFEDLGFDSLEMVEASMEMEDEFDIQIPDEAIDGMTTVGDVINGMCELLGA